MRNGYTAAALLGLALVFVSAAAQAAPACDYEGCTWLATGTVTKVDGSTIYLLGKDNVVYTIDARDAETICDGCNTLRVGGTVRVYGTVIDTNRIRASRVRLCPTEPVQRGETGKGPAKEIRIIVEPEPAPQVAVPSGTQPGPGECAAPASWTGRGLVTDVDYTGRRVKIRTSIGQFSINVGGAQLSNGSRVIGLSGVGQGDAVRVTGRLVGLNEIDATELRIVRTRVESESALPQKPISVVGTIRQIDYPSLTFTMTTESTPIVVLADSDTYVQQQGKRAAFMELRPGMRVRMSGYGSLATGYAANEIQIVSISP